MTDKESLDYLIESAIALGNLKDKESVTEEDFSELYQLRANFLEAVEIVKDRLNNW